MRLLSGLSLVVLLAACSDDNTTVDSAVNDLALTDAGVIDKAVDDAPVDDTSTQDKGPAGDAAQPVSCSQPTDPCPGSLSCLCCGAIGPKPICLCTKSCAKADDCKDTTLPECNMAPGADAGICTSVGYNCCWFCQ